MSYPNGRLPASALSPIPGGRLAAGGPARSWLAMRWFVYKKTGVFLYPTGPRSSYRSLEAQKELYADWKAGRGALASIPGRSNHGLGRAVDVPLPAQQAAIRRWGKLFKWGIAGDNALGSDAPGEPWHSLYHGPAGASALNWRTRLWYARYRAAKRRGRSK
jgi:D-alanyl-D-alanine carboxypeptidase